MRSGDESPSRSVCIARLAAVPLLLAVVATAGRGAASAASPALLVLQETGRTQDSLPVLEPSPRGAVVAAVLTRGFSGRLLRLYELEQEYLRKQGGREIQPAVLLLSHRQGGFPCRGFVLDGKIERDRDYVDLFEKSDLAGSFGAIDQIFPHELAHVMVRELAGDKAPGGSNQMHAIGVATDPETAFSEGFAEHMQIMALEDPEADPRTRSTRADRGTEEWAANVVRQYRREMTARAAWFTPRRAGFVLWFSRAEQIQSYHAVSENLFARSAILPDRLLRSRDPYPAYLLANILPGRPDDPPKSIPRMLSTEGVISSFFYRWATSPELQGAYRDDAFYRRFGVAKDQVSPLQNVYLKLMHAFYLTKPQTAREAIEGYVRIFPEDAAAVQALARQTFLGDLPASRPAIWLANPGFRIGTSLFDQFRALPQIHMFDLNAADASDLAAVRGITPALAAEILRRQPLTGVDQIAEIPGMPPVVLARLREMAAMADAIHSGAASGEGTESRLSISAILRSYVLRALLAIAIAALAGAGASRLVLRKGWGRPLLRALGAALVGLPAGWLAGGAGGLAAIAAVGIVLGLPSAIWTAARSRSGARALQSFLTWIAAGVPAAVLLTPWF